MKRERDKFSLLSYRFVFEPPYGNIWPYATQGLHCSVISLTKHAKKKEGTIQYCNGGKYDRIALPFAEGIGLL